MDYSDTVAYCTIVAQNYLPQALVLHRSIQTNDAGHTLYLMVVDGAPDWLEDSEGLRILAPTDIGLSPTDINVLAMIYDVVEYSTAIKPMLLKHLLVDHEKVAYLDPDMYVTSPLREVDELLDHHAVLLTPHFIEPIPPGSTYVSEVHSLTVGVANLGFCAVSRQGVDFLDWWWSHLERECLIYPLLGIFVDQKWTDVGAALFNAHFLKHYGYNIGPWNLDERPLASSSQGTVVGPHGHPARLLHFSGFDPNDPEAVSERLNADLRHVAVTDEYKKYARLYAGLLHEQRRTAGPLAAYRYSRDSLGKRIPKRLRQLYRADVLDTDRVSPPSAFNRETAGEYKSWRRKAHRRKYKLIVADSAIAAKYAFPDSFLWFKRKFPRGFRSIRASLLSSGRVRR